MTIFVIGKSQTGKTTFAKTLVKKYPELLGYFSASEWVREACPKNENETDENHRNRMTQFSIVRLQHNPFFSAERISNAKSVLETDSQSVKVLVVEGIRNPIDFHSNFDPTSDFVIFLVNKNKKTSLFDSGVDVISQSTDWLIMNNILPPISVFHEDIDTSRGLYASIDNYIVWQNKSNLNNVFNNASPVLISRKCT